MQALHFGAGSIGRGFIGKLLSESSYEVIFVDIDPKMIDQLNTDREYEVETVGANEKVETVKNVSGVLSGNISGIIEISEKANLITTAVGANVLVIIASTMAEIIKNRKEKNITDFLNIIACENKLKASSFLKEKTTEYLNEEEKAYLEKYVAFVDSAVDRLVPPRKIEGEKITYTIVEEFYEWIVDQNLIKGDLSIAGMTKAKELYPFIERKLFTVNTGHAIAAYMGCYSDIETIDQAIMDEEIRKTVIGAMWESGNVLINRYGFNKDEHGKYIDKIIKRFENKYLGDTTVRVGREPLRKLGVKERLIRPLLGTEEYNLTNDNLIKGIGYALKYDYESDTESVELQKYIKNKGLKETLKIITEGQLSDRLIEKIRNAYEKI